MTTNEILESAKRAKAELSALTDEEKSAALKAIADGLNADADKILSANAEDVKRAKFSNPVMLDRLVLNRDRIQSMARGIMKVASLPDPVGRVLEENTRSDGLKIIKISVPIGVIGIIYESRPNVTSDAAALALKSGNVCVLRSGKEAYLSARAITDSMRASLNKLSLNPDFINLIDDVSRESATELMRANGYVDLLIPRGGAGLIRACVDNATVPCIETGTGICHAYVDEYADLKKALDIIENAKADRPSVCNALEVCLVDKKIAKSFLPMLKKRLTDERTEKNLPPVELRSDEEALSVIGGKSAEENDFDTEFLNYILAVKTVDGVKEAIAHISAHSTGHSDCIITENEANAELFLRSVDSAAVYVNASTRFTDGGEFGLGCEMGISTQKLHARGPMGLKELTSYKYVIIGNGHIRNR